MDFEFFKNEKKYSNVFNYLPNILLRTTITSIVRYISQACFSLLGYRPEDLTGKSFIDLYVDKNERKVFLRQLNEKGKVNDVQLHLRARDGSLKIVSVNAQYYYNENNEAEGIEGVLTDVTNLVKAREDIEKTREFFEKTLNSITADIAVFDEENRYCFVNVRAIKDAELRKWLIGKTNFDYCE